jgi:hypothetical protein
MSPVACLYCGCTEHAPCDGGCAWANAEETICTVCQAAVDIAAELVTILGVVAANPKAGLRIHSAKWTALTVDQQRVLVMTTRATIDGIRAALLESIAEDAVAAALELNVITGWLLEKAPEAIGVEDTASDVVIRLLAPHVGSRIVLPGATT